jgi:hypothetical protein
VSTLQIPQRLYQKGKKRKRSGHGIEGGGMAGSNFNGANLAGVASGSERGSRKCSMINRTTQNRSDQQFPGVLQEPSKSRQPGVPLRQLGPFEALDIHPALIQVEGYGKQSAFC